MIRSLLHLHVALMTAALSLMLSGCKERQHNDAPGPSLGQAAASASAPASVSAESVASASAAASVPPPAGHPPFCEVEIFGEVTLPKGAKGGTVYVATDDCLAPDAHMLGHAPVQPGGHFFIEVPAPWASDLTICAAGSEPGKPAEWYGRANAPEAGRFHVEGLGEVLIPQLKIVLARGKPHTFSTDVKLPH